MYSGGAGADLVRASSASYTTQYLWQVFEAAVAWPWRASPAPGATSFVENKPMPVDSRQAGASGSGSHLRQRPVPLPSTPESGVLPSHQQQTPPPSRFANPNHRMQQQPRRPLFRRSPLEPLQRTLREFYALLEKFINRLPLPTYIQVMLLNALYIVLGWAA